MLHYARRAEASQFVWSLVTHPKIYENFRKSLRHRGDFPLAEASRA
jgi:hypothetical protein